MWGLLRQGRTPDPNLRRIFAAQAINRLCGTSIGPWDVDDLPDDLVNNILELPRIWRDLQHGWSEVEQVQQRIRELYKPKV